MARRMNSCWKQPSPEICSTGKSVASWSRRSCLKVTAAWEKKWGQPTSLGNFPGAGSRGLTQDVLSGGSWQLEQLTSDILPQHEQLMAVVKAGLLAQEVPQSARHYYWLPLQPREGRVEGLQAWQIGKDLRLRTAEADITEEFVRLAAAAAQQLIQLTVVVVVFHRRNSCCCGVNVYPFTLDGLSLQQHRVLHCPAGWLHAPALLTAAPLLIVQPVSRAVRTRREPGFWLAESTTK